MVQRYKKIPTEIEALQWTGDNHRSMYNFLGGDPNEHMTTYNDNFYISHSKVEHGLVIKTLHGDMSAHPGDYVVKETINKDIKYYPCKADIFETIFVKF